MAAALLKSTLEGVVEQFSGQSFKKQSITNALKNRGVKDVELQESGVNDYIKNYDGDKIPINDLKSVLKHREDKITTETYSQYSNTRENTFDITNSEEADAYGVSLYKKKTNDPEIKSHFQDKGYYSHARYTDADVDNSLDRNFDYVGNVKGDTRVVHELQSDKHGAGTATVPPTTEQASQYSDNVLKIQKLVYPKGNESTETTNALIKDFLAEFNEVDTGLKLRVMNKYVDMFMVANPKLKNVKLFPQKFQMLARKLPKIEKPEAINIKKDSKYLDNTINKTLVDAFNDGKTRVDIRIGYDKDLARSAGVQKWYENTVKSKAEKIGKKIGAEVSFDGNYVKLALPAAGFSLPLYAKEFDEFEKEAKAAGYTDEQIQEYIDESSETIETNNTQNNGEFEKEAKAAGYTDEQIQEYITQQTSEPTDELPADEPSEPTTIPSVDNSYWGVNTQGTQQTDTDSVGDNATQLAASYNNIHARWATLGKMAYGSWFDSKEQAMSAMKDINDLNNGLIKSLREKGINAYLYNGEPIYNAKGELAISPTTEVGALLMKDDNGQHIEIEPDMFDVMLAGKFETGGAITGAIAGASLGSLAGPAGSFISGAVGAVVGVAGSALGASLGSGVDYLVNSYELKDELEGKVALSKMYDAGIADATMTIVLGTAWKYAGKPIATTTLKFVNHAYKMFKDGNQKGAFEILLKDQNMTRDQAFDTVRAWKKISGVKSEDDLPKMVNKLGVEKSLTDEQLVTKVISETRTGGEYLVSAAEGSKMPIINAIDTRAKDLTETVNRLAPGNPAGEVRHALQDYQVEVGKYYEDTKNLASDIIDKTSYRFDMDKLTIKPSMLEAGKHIEDPYQVERFQNIMKRIDNIAEYRTFSGLLDLRTAVNSVKSKAKNKIAFDSLKKSVNAIDREIQLATKEYLPKEQSKLWLSQFRSAKKAYAKMKQLESNVLFKSIISKKGVTEDNIIKRLTDLAPALDDTFVEVMEKLPKGLRDKTEGAVLKMLTEKYTVGFKSELQAVHFPALNDKLGKYNFKSPQAKQYLSLVKEFSNVFKNDINLGRLVGNLQIPKFQSYLTTDPIARIKYEIASNVFSYVKTLVPGASSDRLALVRLTSKMLENPLSAKETKAFIRRFPKAQRFEIEQKTKKLREEWTRAGMNSEQGKETLKLYKATTKKEITRTNGGFGSGYYLRESLLSARESRGVLRHDIIPSQLATLKDISKVMGRDVSQLDIRKLKSLTGKLKRAGYKGMRNEGRVMLFDKPEIK